MKDKTLGSIVMCPPFYFDVSYELSTNRWMDTDVKPNRERAYTQWLKLLMACQERLHIEMLPPDPALPDMAFCANAGLPYQDLFIVSNFYHQERRPESIHAKEYFSDRHQYTILELPEGAYFEGQGDAVWFDEKTLLIGYGVRTNLKGVEAVEGAIQNFYPQVKVIPLPMRPVREYAPDEKIFYHLDTCFLYLPHTPAFLLYPRAFMPKALEALKDLGMIMEIEKEEAENFVCNSVVIDKNTIFLPWVNDRVGEKLWKMGYKEIRVFPMSEFLKSGGAVKCLILEIH